MVSIREVKCPTDKYSIKCPYTMTPEFIVIHNTANKAPAKNEIAYMHENNSILTTFTGLMSISSLVLSTIAVTGIPALLGAKVLDWTVDIIIPIAKKLSKNNKYIIKAVASAVLITVSLLNSVLPSTCNLFGQLYDNDVVSSPTYNFPRITGSEQLSDSNVTNTQSPTE